MRAKITNEDKAQADREMREFRETNRTQHAPKGRVYRVSPGRSIHWPDGSIRGLGDNGYAVVADDPTVAHYFRNGEPSMMVVDNAASPASPETWPPRWRREAGPKWQLPEESAADIAAREKSEKEAAAAKAKAAELEAQVSTEIPAIDEPLSPKKDGRSDV